MDSASTSLDSGPVARTTALDPSASVGTSRTSPRTTSTSGCASTACVTAAENALLSTASAPPAGTLHSSAVRYRCEPSSSSSRFSMPAALSPFVDFSEFEHTSSARSEVWCTPVATCGRIS